MSNGSHVSQQSSLPRLNNIFWVVTLAVPVVKGEAATKRRHEKSIALESALEA